MIFVEGDDLEVLLDLGKDTEISKISVGFLEDQSFWIFHPSEIDFALSKDGREFYSHKTLSMNKIVPNENRDIKDFSVFLKNQSCRYVRVNAKGVEVCPQWHKGAGGRAWLFVDEIIIE